MAVDIADFKEMYPEFASETDARIELFLDMAILNVNSNVWDCKTDQGVALLTAHFMTLANRGGSTAGPVTQEKVGDLSRSYGMVKTEQDDLGQTAYGQMFLTLLKTLVTSPRVVGCP